MSLPLGPIPLPVSRLSIQLLQWGPQPSTQPSPMTPLASPYIRIGSGCPSPLLSASWLPCCSLRIPGASRWPGGFLRVTLNCSGRRGSRGQNSMLNVILHTASLTQQEQMTEGQKKEVGRHPVSADPVHPGYSQGTLGPWELPQTIFVFWKQSAAYPIVNPAVSGLFPALTPSPTRARGTCHSIYSKERGVF